MNLNFTEIEKKFSSTLKDAERILEPLTGSIKSHDLDTYNAGWGNIDETNRYFIHNEKNRFLNVLNLITNSKKKGAVVDLGCQIPYLPVVLSLLGYKVRIVDNYEYYSNAFKTAIREIAQKTSIEVHDLDIINDEFKNLEKNDIVLLMAVVEHLSGSPKKLMLKIHDIMAKNALLIFEVPNIAEFTKRLKSLTGSSPLASYESYFNSGYPFVGHNREMTVCEVVYLLENTGFCIEALECYDYAEIQPRSYKGKIAQLIKKIMPIKDKHQLISVVSRLKD